MSDDAPIDSRAYNLKSPGDGVFRVLLTSADGKVETEAFFAGYSSSEEVLLPPGDYRGLVEELASGANAGSFALTLPDETTDSIALEEILQPSFKKERRLTGERMEFTSTLDKRASVYSSRALEKTASVDLSIARPVLKSIAQSTPPTVERRFQVGLSQDDAPHATGGWKPARDVSCNANWESNRLLLSLYDNDWERRSKLQMTISIEDVPEIRVPLPMFADGISVSLVPLWDGATPDLGVEITPNDKRLSVLVAALAKLSDEETIEVLGWAAGDTADIADGFLYRKRSDTWGAVLAALVLVSVGEYRRAQWVYNLAKIAPHIPDAGIAAAWVKLAVGEDNDESLEEEALHYLRRSSWAKQPAFAVANSLNLELLNSLRHSAAKKRVRIKASAIYREAIELSRNRLFKSAYMIWEDTKSRSQGRFVAPEIHTQVAEGAVSDAGLRQ